MWIIMTVSEHQWQIYSLLMYGVSWANWAPTLLFTARYTSIEIDHRKLIWLNDSTQ